MVTSHDEFPEPAGRSIVDTVSRRTVLRGAALVGAATGLTAVATGCGSNSPSLTLDGPPLLGEPYLLDPAERSVRVAWCTTSKGTWQTVVVGPGVTTMSSRQILAAATGRGDRTEGWRRYTATSQRLSLTREDKASQVPGLAYASVEPREVWRHLAEVEDIQAGRHPYRVVSVDSAGRATLTAPYTLAPALSSTDHVRLLLTSDHQLKPMTAANLEVAAKTVGVELDGVLMAGDCVNVPDRASEWFDSATGPAFFASLTGRASRTIAGRRYQGAAILQHTPIFPSIGNHEVMGRWSQTAPLATQFNDPQPLEVATRLWETARPAGATRDAWIAQHSWNTTTYEELFPFPRSEEGGPRWYSRSIGDVFLVSLFVTRIWRSFDTTGKGKFQEATGTLDRQDGWGLGDFIFEPIKRGSRQYLWLERTLSSTQARNARYRLVMFHHSSHGLGWNSVPAFVDPVQATSTNRATGRLASVTYSYPLAEDHVLRDVEPLLNASDVNLVLNGHSHVWNRFRNTAGVNWLETSNVGQTFGAFDVSSGAARPVPARADLVAQGDPGYLTPITPSVAPLAGPKGARLAYVASNDITVFSMLDSAKGTVASYRFDTRTPQATPVLFDEFSLD